MIENNGKIVYIEKWEIRDGCVERNEKCGWTVKHGVKEEKGRKDTY